MFYNLPIILNAFVLLRRPSHSAENNLASHLYPVFENHKLKLNGLLKAKNNDIELIGKQINRGRKDVEKLSEEISQLKDIVQVFIISYISFISL